MVRPDDADVVAAGTGDIGAFERLVTATQGQLWRYLVHLLGDAALAEDVRQEVYIRVYSKVSSLRDPERFLPWLMAMAQNAAYDAIRARRRRQMKWLQVADTIPMTTSPDPHIEFEVADALSHLEPELREALVMVTIVGMSYAEVAVAVGVPEGTVKSRVFRARQQMVLLLKGSDSDQ